MPAASAYGPAPPAAMEAAVPPKTASTSAPPLTESTTRSPSCSEACVRMKSEVLETATFPTFSCSRAPKVSCRPIAAWARLGSVSGSSLEASSAALPHSERADLNERRLSKLPKYATPSTAACRLSTVSGCTCASTPMRAVAGLSAPRTPTAR